MSNLITYASPHGPVYTVEDLKLEFGNSRFQELMSWIEANVPASRRLKDEVAVADVEAYMTRKRQLLL